MTTKKSPNFKLENRDMRILRDIGRFGGLSADQVSTLHFPLVVIPDISEIGDNGKHPPKMMTHSNCQRRLKLLLEAGFIQRIERYILLSQGKKSYFYIITKKGAEVVASLDGGSIADTGWKVRETRVRSNYIEHHIRVNDVRSAMEKALEAAPDLELVEWHDDLTLQKNHNDDKIGLKRNDGKFEYVKLLPDAYFAIRDANGVIRHHFLELDMGSESASSSDPATRTFKRKIATYLLYFSKRKGASSDDKSLFEKRYGAPGARVLTVTTSSKRLQRLIEVSEDEGALQRFWFTTYAQVVEPIIQFKGMEYRERRGEEREVYKATLPDILTNPIWTITKDVDPMKPLHPLAEPFQRSGV